MTAQKLDQETLKQLEINYLDWQLEKSNLDYLLFNPVETGLTNLEIAQLRSKATTYLDALKTILFANNPEVTNE